MLYTDKYSRSIEIDTESYEPDIVAKHNNIEVGRVQFDCDERGMKLHHMNVNTDYRRAGIATEMIRRGAEIYGNDFAKPSFLAYGGECHEYYTQDGAALIRHCLEENILVDTERYDEF
ncbi:hypothetical protein WKW81_08625 [Vibrio alginolyticus]|uniref:GNAT family N-acetyltransferase n=1 Tax=Vibrio alginolyticus TaxID=663 RepID=UPI002807650E|nr:hypothetical protein [Vibrio alginolyticus]